MLDTLTDPRFGRFTPGSSNYTPEMLADLQTLGTLTRLTMLSDELPAWKADAVRDELVAYANAQIAAAPGPDGAPSPTGRVAMLLTAMQDGVKQGYKGLEDDRAAQERVVGFFTDVLVGQAAKGAGTLVPGGQLAQVVGGQLIDVASAEGKTLLREGVTDLLFGAYDTRIRTRCRRQ